MDTQDKLNGARSLKKINNFPWLSWVDKISSEQFKTLEAFRGVLKRRQFKQD